MLLRHIYCCVAELQLLFVQVCQIILSMFVLMLSSLSVSSWFCLQFTGQVEFAHAQPTYPLKPLDQQQPDAPPASTAFQSQTAPPL